MRAHPESVARRVRIERARECVEATNAGTRSPGSTRVRGVDRGGAIRVGRGSGAGRRAVGGC
jgi:hypothetical protein